ncbi:MAG: VWA domain-containing protein [Bryobacteraceae bacterium]
MALTRTILLSVSLGSAWAQVALGPPELVVTSRDYVPPSAVLRVDGRLVEIPVVVRDRAGNVVTDLKKGDFEVREEGHKRALTSFSIEKAPVVVPRDVAIEESVAQTVVSQDTSSVVLLFDDLNASVADMLDAQKAVSQYLKLERRTIAISSVRSGMLSPFTQDRDVLLKAVAGVRAHPQVIPPTMCPTFTPYLAYVVANRMDQVAFEAKVTELYSCDPRYMGQAVPRGRVDPQSAPGLKVIAIARELWEETSADSKSTLQAIRLAIQQLSARRGRRTLVMVSSGLFAGTLLQQQQAVITEAVRSSVVIDGLDAKGLSTGDTGGASTTLPDSTALYAQTSATRALDSKNDALVNLAASTGGTMVQRRNDLDQGLRELTSTPQVTYVLGFAPEKLDGEFHKIEVKVTGRKQVGVQARLGYVAEKAVDAAPERDIDRAVFTTEQKVEFPVGVGISSEADAKLQATFEIDLRRAGLIAKGGVRRQRVEFVVALLDKNGGFVAGKAASMEFALTEKTFAQVGDRPVQATLHLQAAPGEYRLRVLVQEANGSKMSAAVQDVRIQ